MTDLIPQHQPAFEGGCSLYIRNLCALWRNDPRLADFVELLHGEALLAEGAAPRDPRKFTKLVADLMTRAV